jgi:hypothetical protein
MLIALNTGLRFRLALALAAFASFCFIAPPAVLAFGHGDKTAHCLANADAVNHGMPKAHDTQHHGDHVMAKDSPAQLHEEHAPPASDQPAGCCGLYCLSALTANGAELVAHVLDGSPQVASFEEALRKRAPERPDRPPNSLARA